MFMHLHASPGAVLVHERVISAVAWGGGFMIKIKSFHDGRLNEGRSKNSG
jgi:hypothetical protein